MWSNMGEWFLDFGGSNENNRKRIQTPDTTQFWRTKSETNLVNKIERMVADLPDELG